MDTPKAKTRTRYGTMEAASGWDDWSAYDECYSYGRGKEQRNCGTRSSSPEGSKGESRDQFIDRLMWKDIAACAWTGKEVFSEIVARRVRTDLDIEDEGSSRSYDEGGMEHEDEDHAIVPKSRKVEKRQLHRKRQQANTKRSSSPVKTSRRGWSTWNPLFKGISMKTTTAP